MIGKIFGPIFSAFRHHKLRMFGVLTLGILIFVLGFPARDLSDLVSTRASKMTGTYMQFDELNLKLFPSPGIHAENVLIEPSMPNAQLPPVKASSIDIAVSVLSALTARLGATIDIAGLFKGRVSVGLQDGEKLKSGEREKIVDLAVEKVNLAELSDYLRDGGLFAQFLQGQLDTTSNLRVDPMFGVQPRGQVRMNVLSFAFPSQSVQTPMGPMTTPPIALSKVALQAKMGDGTVEVQNLDFGGPGDDLSGKVTGNLGTRFLRDQMGVRPLIGAVDLNVDLTIKKAYVDANADSGVNILLDFLREHKRSETPQSLTFVFRVRGQEGQPPMIQRAQ